MLGSIWLWIVVILAFAVTFIINYYNRKFRYWSDRGLTGPKPQIFFGNLLDKFVRSRAEVGLEYAEKYGKLYGYYNGAEPALFVMDNELIKDIMIKDFHCFLNRPKVNVLHKMFINNLLFAEDDTWKRIRTITSPSFTSGKLRAMVPLMEKCIDKFVAYFDKMIQENNGLIDVKKVTSGFTIDVIASTSFATETNANDDRSGKNAFVENGKKLFEIPIFRAIAIFLFPPKLLKMLNILLLADPDAFEFFVNLTQEIVRQRKTQQFKRNDLVQLMMDAFVDEKVLEKTDFEQLSASLDDETNETNVEEKVDSKKTLSENEIIANSVFFFFAGFETTSSTISHCMYELAKSPDVQERLYHEVKDAIDQNKSMDYYDLVINHIPYLEAVIKETLRMYPPVTEILRRVTVDKYKIKDFTIDKDTVVAVPAHAVHYCADYYPNPEKFDPNRFMPENKHLLVPYTYMPFGQGPRNCMGMRFAYQEVKLCMARLALKYQFNVTQNTPKQLTFKPISPLLRTSDIELQLTKRQ